MLRIGPHHIKNPFILAPMAGVSQLPFRRLAFKLGAGLAPTELISAKGLYAKSVRTQSYLICDKNIERPFSVQLFGGEKESMAYAALIAMEMGADIIDINMGCPVKKVTKINAGSALLCDVKRAVGIVEAMQKKIAYKIPITVKIRSGWDEANLNYLEVGRALQNAGIAAIALHARTRAQGYSGKANWLHIAELKDKLSIPVIGNGDVRGLKDAQAMKALTECDGVMIGRAALGNPWIFRTLNWGTETKVTTIERQLVVREHLDAHVDLCRQIAETQNNRSERDNDHWAILSFRSHLLWYSKGLANGASFRKAVTETSCKSEILALSEEFFSKANFESSDESEDNVDYRQAFG